MKNDFLILDGLSPLDMISLQKALDDEQIWHKDISQPVDRQQTIGKNFEPVSTIVLAIAITNVAISVISLWLKHRADKQKAKSTVTVKVGDLTVTIEEKDNSKLDGVRDKLGAYSDLLGKISDLAKEFGKPAGHV
jgi:hypothetical protein